MPTTAPSQLKTNPNLSTLDDNWTLLDPGDGFGQLWHKRYAVDLGPGSATPQAFVREWRDHFGEFWPEGNRFYPPLTGLQPGELAVSEIEMPAGATLTTGVAVDKVTPTSFSFKTPRGHTFAGVITFTGKSLPNSTVAQVDVVMRASDPFFEIGMFLGGHRREDQFWIDTLTNVSRQYGNNAAPTGHSERLDAKRHWRNAPNIIHNGMLHTALKSAQSKIGRLAGRFSRNGFRT